MLEFGIQLILRIVGWVHRNFELLIGVQQWADSQALPLGTI
jgi:hypothetical protein